MAHSCYDVFLESGILMVTKHTVITFTCDVCKAVYPSVTEAATCQESPLLPTPPFKAGDEVRLRNRGGRTYTVAKLLCYKPVASINGHRWSLVLDRTVCLDHKWEDSLDTVSVDYLVSDTEAASMEWKDNDHGG